MANKTIPELNALTSLQDFHLFPVDNTAETFKITAENIAAYIAASILQPGIVVPFAGSVAPAGWLLCHGQAVSRTTYSNLFSVIGVTFGSGDGSTTFNLPDVRGRVIAGKDDMGGSAASRLTSGVSSVNGASLGASGGSENCTGSIGGTQSVAHVHNVSHTHNIAHYHQWGRAIGPYPTESLHTVYSPSVSTTSIGSTLAEQFARNYYITVAGSGNPTAWAPQLPTADGGMFTTGVISPPSGSSGSGATSGSSSISDSSAMSANSIVNGSNFTFTSTGSKNVQPTIVMNKIIKT